MSRHAYDFIIIGLTFHFYASFPFMTGTLSHIALHKALCFNFNNLSISNNRLITSNTDKSKMKLLILLVRFRSEYWCWIEFRPNISKLHANAFNCTEWILSGVEFEFHGQHQSEYKRHISELYLSLWHSNANASYVHFETKPLLFDNEWIEVDVVRAIISLRENCNRDNMRCTTTIQGMFVQLMGRLPRNKTISFRVSHISQIQNAWFWMTIRQMYKLSWIGSSVEFIVRFSNYIKMMRGAQL